MRRDNELSLSQAIKKMLKSRGLDEKLLETEIYQRWEELAGREINLKTKKVRFKNGILEVYVSSAALRQNLSLQREELRNKVNLRLANQPVKTLIVR